MNQIIFESFHLKCALDVPDTVHFTTRRQIRRTEWKIQLGPTSLWRPVYRGYCPTKALTSPRPQFGYQVECSARNDSAQIKIQIGLELQVAADRSC